jgi:Tol biopolymer transport system component
MSPRPVYAGRRLASATLLGLAILAATAPLARAKFGPIELVSKSAKEQADLGTEPAISGDGRYVAFAGKLGGREGVFRKDLQTGEVAFVAPGRTNEPMLEPSISADGRYVAFTTTERILPSEDPEPASKDVYVADLETSPPSYELASAADESGQALPGEARAVGRVALSADGRKIVFTDGGQVYVRDLDTKETILISVRREPLTGEPTTEPVPEGGVLEGVVEGAARGAALSADGSTVAWIGRHLPEQVPMLADEEATVRSRESGSNPIENSYFEPLWRRVPTTADPKPPIRRVVGGGDPLAPGCPPGGTLKDPACQGPYPEVFKSREFLRNQFGGYGWGMRVPQLSADGDTVVVVGNPDEDYDLFVVDMAPGLDRDEAVHQLTHWVDPAPESKEVFEEPEFEPYWGPIESAAISPDGEQIAFTTARQFFSPNPPSLITPPPPGPSVFTELYQLNLESKTIERATPGGGQAVSLNGGAGAPSYSTDGRLLAFESAASNLVTGDTNEGEDAFVVASSPPASAESSVVSPRPPALVPEPRWHLSVTAISLPDGTVRLLLGVPGSGAARAKATAALGPRLHSRRVAAGRVHAAAAGTLRLGLSLPHRLRGLAHRKDGLYARVRVSFAGRGGNPLHAELDVRFCVHRKRASHHRRVAG